MKSVNGIWMPGLINKAYADICSDINKRSGTNWFKETLKPLLKDGACPFVKVKLVNLNWRGAVLENMISMQGTHDFGELEFDSLFLMGRIPPSIFGKWRAEVKIEKDGSVLSCDYFYFSFIRTWCVRSRCYNPNCKFNKTNSWEGEVLIPTGNPFHG